MKSARWLLLIAAMLFWFVGGACFQEQEPSPDNDAGASSDAAVNFPDGGAFQDGAPPPDAAIVDGAVNDAMVNDAMVNDAGVGDAMVNDAGVSDAAMNDAAP